MMKKQKAYPCTNCCRTEDPALCDNKECGLWRSWFINRWEALRRLYLPARDPCKSCPCPGALCTAKCSAKLAWEEENR